MKQLCLGVVIAAGLTLPAFALDGTRSPNNVAPPAVPGIQLRRDAAELLERAAQLRRDAAELLAQVTPGNSTQGIDPYIGTWKFNLEKSTWIGTPAPKRQTLIYTGDGNTLLASLIS